MRALALVLSSALAVATGTASSAAMKPAAAVPISIVATAAQTFVPNHVVLHVNKRQTLRFTSAAGVHGIGSPELGIPATMIMPDRPVTVAVMPKKTGTYKLPCTVICGTNHADMKLTIEVKP